MKRYDGQCHDGPVMSECDDGDFVLYSDLRRLIESAYRDGYFDGNRDGQAYTGCRNVYDHTPRDDADAAWVVSDIRHGLDGGWL